MGDAEDLDPPLTGSTVPVSEMTEFDSLSTASERLRGASPLPASPLADAALSPLPLGRPDLAGGEMPTALGDSGLKSQTLESVADAENYHDWLTSLALPYLGDSPLELGSGLGDYAQRWLDAGVPTVTVTEVDPDRLDLLRQRFRTDPRVHVTGIDVLNPPPGDYSAFAAFNVLEHIPDHVEALRAAHSLVRPGGAVIMFVPAFEFAMSRFDRQAGHVRRYTVGSLTTAMRQAGLEVETARHVNIPGLLAWFVGMRLLRMTPGSGGILDVWDSHVIPRTRRFEAKRQAPFGQSVFAVARVPGTRLDPGGTHDPAADAR